MIEYLGFLYGVAKDVRRYFTYREARKIVEFNWPRDSGFAAEAQKAGFVLRWVNSRKVDPRMGEGYEIMYEIDTSQQTRNRLELYDGSVLMGRPVEKS